MDITFGKILQKIRRNKGMTQRDVSKAIGMDFSYFSRLENDRFDSKPTRETIDRIADALKCNKEERDELFAAAGRIPDDIEKAARMTGENPVLGKLFRSAIYLSPERLNQIVEEIEAEVKSTEISKQENNKND